MYDELQLADLGVAIGQQLCGGEVIELVGDVGAGKTTLTRSIARGMGIAEPMQSPTFTIVNRYENAAAITLAHYDFYRLQDAGVMRDELREALDDQTTVVVVEWGDIIAEVLPEDRLTITLQPASETEREVLIEPRGKISQRIVEAIA